MKWCGAEVSYRRIGYTVAMRASSLRAAAPTQESACAVLKAVFVGSFLAAGVMIGGSLVAALLAGLSGASATPVYQVIIQLAAIVLAQLTIGGLYLKLTGRGIAYLDIERPELSDFVPVIGGLGAILLVLVGVNLLLSMLDVGSAQHSVVSNTDSANYEVFLYLVPISIFVIGPTEELMFRNIIQKRLRESLSMPAAIIGASVIFALIHIPSYATAGLQQLVVSLTMVFLFAIILGSTYEHTENIVVPMVIHGFFNALQFLLVYSRVAM